MQLYLFSQNDLWFVGIWFIMEKDWENNCGSRETDAEKIIHHLQRIKGGVKLQLHLAKIQNCLVLFSFSFLSSSVRIQIKVLIFEVRRPEMRGAAKCTCQKPLCPRFGLLLRSFFTTRLQINRLWSPIYSKSRSSCETRETFSIINPFVIAGTPNWTGELEMSISRSSSWRLEKKEKIFTILFLERMAIN